MGYFEKFLFETSFDSDRSRGAAAKAAAEAAAAAEPPPPSFNEEELAAAKQAAYAEGRAAALAEAEEAHSKYLAEAISALPEQFEKLAHELEMQDAERHRASLEASITVVRKLFPQLSQQNGLEEVQAVIDSCLERLRDEPRLVIRSADQDLDILKERIEDCVTRSAFEGKLVFLADERIASGGVRIEWADGGAERDLPRLWKEIDAVVARALSPTQVDQTPIDKTHTKTDPAPKCDGTHSQPPQSAEIEPLRRANIA